MVRNICVRCGKRFRPFGRSWWCDECIDALLKRNHKPKPMTNADSIRAMSDEELAAFLDATQYREWEEIQENEDELHSYRSCVKGWLAWLKQPVEEDDA